MEDIPRDEDVESGNTPKAASENSKKYVTAGIGCCCIILAIVGIILGTVVFKKDDNPAPPTVAPVAPTFAPVSPTPAPVAPSLAPTIAPTAYPDEFPVIVSNGDSHFNSEGAVVNTAADVLFLVKQGFVLIGFNTSELAALIPTLVGRDFSASLRLAHLAGAFDFTVSSLLAELPGPIETLENFTLSPDDLSAPLTATGSLDPPSTIEVDVTDLLFSAGTMIRRRTKEVPEEITFVLQNADVAEILEFTSRESADGKGPQLLVSLEKITQSPSLSPSMSSAPSVSARPSLRPSTSYAPSLSAIPSLQPSGSSAPSVSAAPSSEERTPGCNLCGEGGVVTNPETIVGANSSDEGTTIVTCSQAAGVLFATATTEQECSAAQENYGIVCGCLLETGCYLCGEGGVIGSPNTLVDVPNPDGEGTVQVTCQVAATGFLATDKTEPECLAAQETYGADCGCLEPATPGCELCGEGGELGSPDAMVEVPNPEGEGTLQVTCQVVTDDLFAADTLEPECSAAQEAYRTACSCLTTGCQLCGESGRMDNPDAMIEVPNPAGEGTVPVTCQVAAAGLLATKTTQEECSATKDTYKTDCGCVEVATGCELCGEGGELGSPGTLVEVPNPAGEGTLQVTCLEARAGIFATETTEAECIATQETYGAACGCVAPSSSLSPSSTPSTAPSTSQAPSLSLSPSIARSLSPTSSQAPSSSVSPSSVSSSRAPSARPSSIPSSVPSVSLLPTEAFTLSPTISMAPSLSSSELSKAPSDKPSDKPSTIPSSAPSAVPSSMASSTPSLSSSPSLKPSTGPSTSMPSQLPSDMPSVWIIPEGGFDNLDWVDLPPRAKAAATTLGYDEDSWDSAQDLDIFCTFWSELTTAEQEAAQDLGYEDTWNDEVFEFCVEDFWYDDVELWDNLPVEIQTELAILGYDATSWEFGPEPDIVKQEWVDLTPAQKEAATNLGWGDDYEVFDWYPVP